MAGGTSGGNERSLEQTPTWAVAVVCSAFVIVSLLIEQAIHHFGTVRFCLQHTVQLNILLLFCTDFWIYCLWYSTTYRTVRFYGMELLESSISLCC